MTSQRNADVNVNVNLNVNLSICETLVTNVTYTPNITAKCYICTIAAFGGRRGGGKRGSIKTTTKKQTIEPFKPVKNNFKN